MKQYVPVPIILATMLTMGAAAITRGDAPMVKTQAPGYYRVMVGQYEVTALSVGSVNLSTQLMHNGTDAQINALLDKSFIAGPSLPTSVNAYLINTGAKLVLIDTGGAPGTLIGRVVEALKAAGYLPTQVDAVLITHMHGDHIGGLLDANGAPAFANATVYSASKESDFWLSSEQLQKAEAGRQATFTLAQKVAKPYQAASRWKTFDSAKLPIDGITAMPVLGHTPGHTVYVVQSEGVKLYVTGDMVHCAAVQFANPGVSFSFDSDSTRAIAARKALLATISEQKALLCGMHLPFPGVGRVRSEGAGSFAYVPIEYPSAIQPK